MTIMEELRLKNRPSYYYEDIVRLDKISLDKITVRKVDSWKCSILEIRYATEAVEKPLRICINNAFGEFFKFGVKIFLSRK